MPSNDILDWLPLNPKAILEIGPGSGWLALEMAEKFPDAVIHLMDGDGTASRRASYREKMEAWNDRQDAIDYVLERIPRVNLVAHGPDPKKTIPVDAIVSLQSWGYHYPVETYLPLARRSLTLGGRIILDHRLNHQRARGGEQVMQAAGYKRLAVLDEKFKYQRVVWG